MSRVLSASIVAFAALSATGPALAEDAKPIEITLQGTVFTPNEVKIPVGQTVVVKFRNLNAAPAEIESKPLKIEKIVQGGGEVVANVKAKAPGKILFVDEYHEDVAMGYFIAE